MKIKSTLCTTATLRTYNLRPLLKGGRYSEVIFVLKAPNGTSKQWTLWTGGHYAFGGGR
jgi:hypothetical protein